MPEMYSDYFNNGSEYQEKQFIKIKPFSRLFARLMDYIIFILLVFFLYEMLFKIKPYGTTFLILYFSAIFIWVFVESLLMCTWGKTPGKWLFSIKVTDRDGKNQVLSGH